MTIGIGFNAAAGSSNGNTATVTGTTTSGSGIFIGVLGDANTFTVTDNKSNTITPIDVAIQLLSGYVIYGRGYYINNATGGTSHTFTVTSTGHYPSIFVQEFTGTNVQLDSYVQAYDSATPYQGGTLTPNNAGCGFVSFIAHNASADSTTAVDSPTIKRAEVSDYDNFYLGVLSSYVQTTATGINPSWTVTPTPGSGAVFNAAFKEGGTPPPPTSNGQFFAFL